MHDFFWMYDVFLAGAVSACRNFFLTLSLCMHFFGSDHPPSAKSNGSPLNTRVSYFTLPGVPRW